LESRRKNKLRLLQRLGTVLESSSYFQGAIKRLGNFLDFLLNHSTTQKTGSGYKVLIDTLWEVVVDGFGGIWPGTRTKVDGISLGDVWPCKARGLVNKENDLVCFHKLSQWLTYSLIEPLQLLNIQFDGMEKMTGLAEYRNGGVFVDYGVLVLKREIKEKFTGIPTFQVWDDVIVEWRSLTVSLLDKVGEGVRAKLGLTPDQLKLVQVLEAGRIC
jgi:hypothetical protein